MTRSSLFETRKGRGLALLVVVVLGICIFLPAVRSPLFLDDYLHVAMVEGTYPGARGPLELYDFVTDADRPALLARGLLPWWTHPELSIRFYRPLSSALLWGLHRLTSHAALPLHLASLGWWLAAVLAVRALYRRLFEERAALLATAIFALSPCHALPLAWVANSEALMALAFGALALDRHLRFRAAPGLRDGALAALGFTLALFSGGEYALAFGGYVLALEVVRRAPLGARPGALLGHVAGVAPFAVPAGAYLAVRAHLGYRAVGSGFYTDPLADPASFLKAAPLRLASLLADGWLTLGSHTWVRGHQRWLLVALVLGAGAALMLVLRRVFAAQGARAGAAARVLAWGSLASLAPTLAVVPAFRLLGVSMIGVAAASALLLDHVWFGPDSQPQDRPSRRAALASATALLVGFSQLVHGPVTALLAARAHRLDGLAFAARAAWTRAHIGAPATADVGVLRGVAGTYFMPYALDPAGQAPARWRILAHAGHVLVLRPAERELELVVPSDRSLYPIGEHNLHRAPGAPLREGDVIHAPGMEVTILEVGAVGPRRARFVFDGDLEATGWLVDHLAGAAEAALPEVEHGAPFRL